MLSYSIKLCSSLQWTGNPGNLTQICTSRHLSSLQMYAFIFWACQCKTPRVKGNTPGWIVPTLSLSSEDTHFSPFIISTALRWTVSSISMSHFHWGAQHLTQCFRSVLLVPRREGSPPLTCWWCQLSSKSCSCQGILEWIQCGVSHWLRCVGSSGFLGASSLYHSRVSCWDNYLAKTEASFDQFRISKAGGTVNLQSKILLCTLAASNTY